MNQYRFIGNNDNWWPSSFSLFPSYLTLEPNPNLGISPMIIISDPTGDVLVAPGRSKRSSRRQLMAEITDEFAALHGDLLRDLAR